MDAPPGAVRRYTDREVRLILKSAVELQQRAADGAEPSGGLSLSELEQVAAEVGIDPTVVRRAAATLDARGDDDAGSRFLGGPTEILVERIVDRPLDDGDFEGLLGVVRGQSRHLGEASTVGRLFGWRGRLDGAKAEVSVSPAGARSQVRVRLELDEPALGHFMLKGALLGVGGGLIATAVATAALGPVGVLLGGAVAGGGYLWARTGFRTGSARYRARAVELADALAAALASRPVGGTTSGAVPGHQAASRGVTTASPGAAPEAAPEAAPDGAASARGGRYSSG
jgi:hypothetical protein